MSTRIPAMYKNSESGACRNAHNHKKRTREFPLAVLAAPRCDNLLKREYVTVAERRNGSGDWHGPSFFVRLSGEKDFNKTPVFGIFFYIFLLFRAVRIRSRISLGRRSFCHFLSVSDDWPAWCTAFRAYHAAPNA